MINEYKMEESERKVKGLGTLWTNLQVFTASVRSAVVMTGGRL